jgi:outer membrane receptor for ferrienterochelin and colicins
MHLPPEQTAITEMADSQRTSGFVRWRHTVSSNTLYSLSSSFQYLSRRTYYGTGYDPNAHGVTGNPLWVNDAQMGRQVERHTLLAGFQVSREQVRDSIPAYQRAFRSVFRNSGLYFQDEFRIAPQLVLVAGVRADKSNTLDHWVASPRANLRVGLGDNWNLRAGISTGFRAPVIFDEDLHVAAVGGAGFVIENARGLRPERSRSFTQSLDYSGMAGGRPLLAGATFFWTSLDGVHVYAEDFAAPGEARRLYRVNGSGSRVRGAEFDFNCRLTPRLALRGGSTFQQARFRAPETDFKSTRYLRTPNRYGFAGADLDLPGKLVITASGDFTGSMLVPHYAGYVPDDRLERSRPFAVFSAVVSRTFTLRDRKKLRFYLRANNLTDSFQPDLDRGPDRDSSYFYGPVSMRGAALGMTLSF